MLVSIALKRFQQVFNAICDLRLRVFEAGCNRGTHRDKWVAVTGHSSKSYQRWDSSTQRCLIVRHLPVRNELIAVLQAHPEAALVAVTIDDQVSIWINNGKGFAPGNLWMANASLA